ncbi:sulfurtransferase/chromate resistance protein [Ahrensia sp. R2A130]|uniref:chromate resistance protein ChrB domain-containing protein n=1 Tax=Ahrensia sp. R2A130 TaxID=744979 RepID=UPI0001E0D0AE|nr:sulfurtransferase/chromate resistance protein [Ahrensia sp. R2A130]EFL90301.1 rhodanese domain-containing protein [Ahrensia sp. R2A130]
MTAFAEISSTQLSRLIGLPDCPIIVDIRIDDDFAEDPQVVPTAVRFAHTDTASLAAFLNGRRSVVYCQKGRKISQGVAALLRAEGLECEVLEGGHFAWRDAPLSLVPNAVIPSSPDGNGTLWVTRHRPKIDRIACPWLIRRFVDRDARFLYVPPSDVELVAEKFGATPFDVEGLGFAHEGDRCSFDAMLDTFGLRTEALDRLSTVIRAADTDSHKTSPQAAGLLAMSVGLSRMYRDDGAQLDAAMPLYDALYRWARDGFDEGHTS